MLHTKESFTCRRGQAALPRIGDSPAAVSFTAALMCKLQGAEVGPTSAAGSTSSLPEVKTTAAGAGVERVADGLWLNLSEWLL
jgi:hypothetical protein